MITYEYALAATVILFVVVLIWYVRSPTASAFHPLSFYLFFHGLIFTFRPIYAYIQHFDSIYKVYKFTPTESEKIQALMVQNLGLVVFALVTNAIVRTPIWHPNAPAAGYDRRTWRSGFLFACALCLPIAVPALWHIISVRDAGISTMVVDGATGQTVNTTGIGYFDSAGILVSTLTVLFAWMWRLKIWAFIPFGIYVIGQSASGGRWPFVMATGSVLLLFLLQQRRRWPPLSSVGIGMLMIAFFSSVGTDRGASVRAIFTGEKQVENIYKERMFEGLDFANMEFNEYIVHIIPDRTGTYDYFASNLVLLTGPVPRVLWPSKPVGSPVQFFAIFDYGTPYGMTWSLPGLGWSELGWTGVILWCGFGAALIGRVYESFARSARNAFQTSAFVMFMPLTLLFFRDGSLPELVVMVAFIELPIVLWLWITRFAYGRKPERRAPVPTAPAPNALSRRTGVIVPQRR